MINLDAPFRLYPMGPEGDPTAVYTTEDEAWLVFRQLRGWLVASADGKGKGPTPCPSIGSAICEIKERITGTEWHRHPPRIVV